MDSKTEVFKKINKPEERAKLLTDLAKAQAEILCKGTADSVFRFRPIQYENKKLYCSLLKTSSALKMTEDVVIANFSLGGDKYFFQAPAHIAIPKKSGDPQSVYFEDSMEIYHLQRRQNYRVKIPESYKAIFEITTVNQSGAQISGRLDDLSSGGCRVVYAKSTTLQMGDVVQARLRVGQREPIEVQAMVRHINVDDTKKSNQVLGMEFETLHTSVENRMFSITLELHRELFSRLK